MVVSLSHIGGHIDLNIYLYLMQVYGYITVNHYLYSIHLCLMQVYGSIAVNFYRYVWYIISLLVNEQNSTQRPQPANTTFEHKLTALIRTDLTGMACQLKQIVNSTYSTRELDDVKNLVNTTRYQPSLSTTADTDKFAYTVLNTFVNDYIVFVVKYFE